MCVLVIFSIQVVIRVQITMQTKRNMSIRFNPFGSPNWHVLYPQIQDQKEMVGTSTKDYCRSPSVRMYSPPLGCAIIHKQVGTIHYTTHEVPSFNARPNCVPCLGGKFWFLLLVVVLSLLISLSVWLSWCWHMSNGKNPGWLGYICDYTTRLLPSYIGFISLKKSKDLY